VCGVCICVVCVCVVLWCVCVCVQITTMWRVTFCLKGSRENIQLAEAISSGGFARSKHIPLLRSYRNM
jgi:hypothetical protein